LKKAIVIVVVGLACLFTVSTAKQKQGFASGAADAVQPLKPSSVKLEADFGKMPLYFIANKGQMDERVDYYVQGKDKSVYFSPEGVTFVLTSAVAPSHSLKSGFIAGDSAIESSVEASKATERWVVKLEFVGADRDVRPLGQDDTGAVISYFKGNFEDWHTGIPTYSRIVYRNLWPGIDLVYSGTVNKLKYEFVVQPGADASKIKMAYSGASEVALGEGGRLEVRTPLGNLRDEEPVAYQEKDGKRVDIPMGFVLEEPGLGEIERDGRDQGPKPRSHAFGFNVGDYDRNLPLIMDPAIFVYCGYIGGSDEDWGQGIAVDASGNAYVTGYTHSTQATFPETGGPDLTHNGFADVFVAKVNASGTGLVYCGYIGGSQGDYGYSIAVDGSGNAYITGHTGSAEDTFPETGGPDLTHNGNDDIFVAKVNASGTALTYCGYIGGSGDDYGYGIDVDGSGNAYVTGSTSSSQGTFPETGGPDLIYNLATDAYVAKVNASGTGLVYCGYIGGSGWDEGTGIAVDGSGNAYVSGYTYSTEATFPVSGGPDLTYNGEGGDAFVAKINSSGTGISYCGYIGGSAHEYCGGIAIDGSGNAYVTGLTGSTQATFPETTGPDLTHNGDTDVFVAKVNSSGSGLVYCGYIGGSGNDYGYAIAVDGSGNAYVTGQTGSSEATFPEKVGPDLTDNGNWEGFVAKVNAGGTGLVYCGYLGGDSIDEGASIAVTGSGHAFVTGNTSSTQATFPETVGPDLSHNGVHDAFVAKISAGKDDYLGTWNSGVYYRNSDTGAWFRLESSPATRVVAGDLDGDSYDDLIGTWTASPGVWVKKSSTGTWQKLDNYMPESIASGDMNGDGRDDLLGSWNVFGVFYRNSVSGAWVKLEGSTASRVAAGDLEGDGKADLIGTWDSQPGVWVKYSSTGTWQRLDNYMPESIASGDMNGDGRDDLLGSWNVFGVFYRDSVRYDWVKLEASTASQVGAGDLDGDGKADLLGTWLSDPGAWVKYSISATWAELDPVSPGALSAGKMRGPGFPGSASRNSFSSMIGLPLMDSNYEDLSEYGPGGSKFRFSIGKNPRVGSKIDAKMQRLRTPGPGEPGFKPVIEKKSSGRKNKNLGG